MQNGIPVGLRSSPSFGLSRSGQLTAIIQSLFWDGSQGWWYDDNDTTTLFQDSAGTTPVTAVEQFVGLQLDKSKGLVLGSEQSPGLAAFTLTASGTWSPSGAGYAFVDTVGGQVRPGVEFPSTSVPSGWYRLTFTVGSITGATQVRVDGVGASDILAGTGTYTGTVFLSATSKPRWRIEDTSTTIGDGFTLSNVSMRAIPGNHRYAPASGNRPRWSKLVNLYVGTTALATQNVTTQATSYVLRFSGTGSITLSGTATGSFNAGVHTVTCTAGTLTSTVSGTVTDADLRPANQATGLLPLYQRVNTSTDYDTNGFPGYLKADGIDDFLQTNSIDFTATDKITLCTGVRKLSDATEGMLSELSANAVSNNGSFFSLPNSSGIAAANTFAAFSHGTAGANVSQLAISAATPAPVTVVFTRTHNISGDLSAIRLNGAASGTNGTGDQGTGNFGNYPAYFFRRGGSSLPFNGNEYGNIAVGKLLTADQLTALETYMNGLTKAY